MLRKRGNFGRRATSQTCWRGCENGGMTTPTLPPIEINIPPAEDEIELSDYFLEFIRTDDGELGGPLLEAFDLEVSNSRAQIDDVEIDEVTVDADGDVEIQYTFTWSAHYGCDDMNKTDQSHGAVAGVKKDDRWLFEPHVQSEPRSTLDEF